MSGIANPNANPNPRNPEPPVAIAIAAAVEGGGGGGGGGGGDHDIGGGDHGGGGGPPEEGRGGGNPSHRRPRIDIDIDDDDDDEEEEEEEEEEEPSGRQRRSRREAELEALLAEARAEAEANRTKADLLDGTYYSTIEQVWGTEYVNASGLGEDDLKALRRTKEQVPSFIARGQRGAAYAETRRCALDPACGTVPPNAAKRSGASSNASSSVHDGKKWPKDVLGREDRAGAELAHLVPARSHRNASLYCDVAMCALGLGWHYGNDDGEVGGDMSMHWATIQKAIHGCRGKGAGGAGEKKAGKKRGPAGAAGGDDEDKNPPGEGPTKKPRLEGDSPAADGQAVSIEKVVDPVAPDETVLTTDSKEKKMARTGLKNMAPNMIRLAGQKYFFDDRPCVLIVPVMELSSALSWKGEGYPALFLVDEGLGAKPATVQTVCLSVRLNEKAKEDPASPEQIEQGRRLLAQVVRGMAYSLRVRSLGWDALLGEEARAELSILRSNFNAGVEGNGDRLALPAPRVDQAAASTAPASAAPASGGDDDDDDDDKKAWPRPPPRHHSPPPRPRVRLVTFGSALDAAAEWEGHPAPDPLLLAARAAVNWSRRHHQGVLSFDEHGGDSDDDGSSSYDDSSYDDDDYDGSSSYDDLNQVATKGHLEARDEARRARGQEGADANDSEDAAVPSFITIPSC